VIEAKKKSLSDTEGVAQAKRYSERLQARLTYSTNGVGIYQIDMHSGKEAYVDRYPTPDELWVQCFARENSWRERFGACRSRTRTSTFKIRAH
jgi:type I restriction enzyme R subunit